MPQNIILIAHDCDLVLYKAFDALASSQSFNITVAGTPGQLEEAAYHAPHCARVNMLPIKGKLSLKAARSLRHIIDSHHTDAIFAVSTSALSTAIIACRRRHKNVAIVGYRGTQARVHRFDPTYRMALLNPRVDTIICETPDIASYLSRFIDADKLPVCAKPFMRQWVEDAIANPVTLAQDAPDALRICYIGITEGRPHKGLNFLVDAIAILNSRHFPVHLTVVGKADDSLIASAPVNISFTGNRRDAINFLPGAQLFVLPSLRDASPRVVREAQACGIPCIVTDIPGARDLIIAAGPDISGITVPAADATALADAIQNLGKDADMRRHMSENALKNIDRNFSFPAYVAFLTDVFTAAIKVR